METKTTIRFYYHFGIRPIEKSFWKRLTSNSFSTDFLKKAKRYGIEQVVCFHVTKGYLHGRKIEWGLGESTTPKHPQCIEITDCEEKIRQFMEDNRNMLNQQHILAVKNEVVVCSNGGRIG